MTLQVSNIAGDGETWRRHVNPKTHRGVCPAWPAKGDKIREGLRAGMRTPAGIRHNAGARTGTWRRQKQVQLATRSQAGTRTTTNAASITDTGERAGAHQIQVRGNTRSTEKPKCRMQVVREAQGVKTRRRQKRHRVSARTTPSLAMRKGCHDTKRR